jgi:hypothetical protein
MIDSFPYEAWDQVSTEPYAGPFWTFGPAGVDGDLTGTFVLTGLGMLLMIAALVYWVVLENRKLWAQTDHLRGAGQGGPPTQTGQ